MEQDRETEEFVNLLAMSYGSGYSSNPSEDECRSFANRFLKMQEVICEDHRSLDEGARSKTLNCELMKEFRSKGTGVIVAAFHLGPYRYVAAELGYIGFNVQLLVMGKVASEQGEIFQRVAKVVARENKNRLDVLIAENPRSMIRVLRGLKQGDAVLTYMDGNTGVGESSDLKHGADFKLLEMPVRMRTGLAFMAQKTECPIVYAGSYYNEAGERIIEYSQVPSPKDKSEDERLKCTIHIYRCFEDLLKKYPEQWEGWMYPYRFWADMKRPPKVTQERLKESQKQIHSLIEKEDIHTLIKANPLKVGCIKLGTDCLVFDGIEHRILGANPLAHEILKKAFTGIKLQDLVKDIDCSLEPIVLEISKLALSGLVKLE